jgi:YHS domain-containing protein
MNRLVLLALIGLLASQTAHSQPDQRKKHFNLAKSGLAIQGYDPVAYISQNKAVEGSKANSVVHEGVIYYFSSAENKNAFIANPRKYEPQYGGWCAYAMGANAEKVSVDPETFKVVDGKLFLFYNKFFTNTLVSWNKDESNLHTRADANWKKIYK